MRFTRMVRSLHLTIACLVLVQLFSELLMKVPKPGETTTPVEALFLLIHEWDGFIVLGMAVFYLLHLSDKTDDWKRLFPWLSAEGCKELWREIRFDVPGWLKGKLKKQDEARAIAGTVHGLGILLLIALGATGTLVFIGLEPDGSMDQDTKLLRELHSDLGELMWIYLCAHAGMAVLHQLLGHRIFQDMFSFRSDKQND